MRHTWACTVLAAVAYVSSPSPAAAGDISHWSDGLKAETVQEVLALLSEHNANMAEISGTKDEEEQADSLRKALYTDLADTVPTDTLKALAPMYTDGDWTSSVKDTQMSSVLSETYEALLTYNATVQKMDHDCEDGLAAVLEASSELELSIDGIVSTEAGSVAVEDYRGVHPYEVAGLTADGTCTDSPLTWEDEWRIFWLFAFGRPVSDLRHWANGIEPDSETHQEVLEDYDYSAGQVDINTYRLYAASQQKPVPFDEMVAATYWGQQGLYWYAIDTEALAEISPSSTERKIFCESHNIAAAASAVLWHLIEPSCGNYDPDEWTDDSGYRASYCEALRCMNPYSTSTRGCTEAQVPLPESLICED